jgi:hypothetical protein
MIPRVYLDRLPCLECGEHTWHQVYELTYSIYLTCMICNDVWIKRRNDRGEAGEVVC